MDKTTIEFGKWRVTRIDPLNWQLFERAAIKKGKRAGETDWKPRSNYFGKLVDAVRFARDREFEQGGYDGSLDGAIGELRRLDERFVSAIRKAVGE